MTMKTCLSKKIIVISQKENFLTRFEKKVATIFFVFFQTKSSLPSNIYINAVLHSVQTVFQCSVWVLTIWTRHPYKKVSFFLENLKVNIWSTFSQHLLPKCCLICAKIVKNHLKKMVIRRTFNRIWRGVKKLFSND